MEHFTFYNLGFTPQVHLTCNSEFRIFTFSYIFISVFTNKTFIYIYIYIYICIKWFKDMRSQLFTNKGLYKVTPTFTQSKDKLSFTHFLLRPNCEKFHLDITTAQNHFYLIERIDCVWVLKGVEWVLITVECEWSMLSRAVTICDMKPKSRHSDPRSCVAVW